MARAQRRQTVTGLLEHITAEVADLPRPVLRDLLPVLAEAERELARDLHAWLATAKNGKARFTAQEYRRSLLQIRTALKKAQTLEPEMIRALRKGGHLAGRLAVGHLRQELTDFSLIFEGSIRSIPLEVAGILVKGDRLLIPRYRASASRYVGSVRDDIRRQLAVGLVRGETMEQLTKRLVRLGGPRGRVFLRGHPGDPSAQSEIIAEGLFRRYRAWAARVARTETINAYNVQADAGLEELVRLDAEIRRRWDATADSRLCLVCRSLDGRVSEVGKPFPGGYTMPPAHPNCRCALTAWRDDWGHVVARPPNGPNAAPAITAPPPPARPKPVPLAPKPAPPIPPPAPPPALNAVAMRDALDERAPRGGLTARAQRYLRGELDRLVGGFGVARHTPSVAGDVLEVKPARRMHGSRGYYTPHDGTIAIADNVHAGALEFFRDLAAGRTPSGTAAHNFRTFVHETLHGHSPMGAGIYFHSGKVVEEVTTEVAARKIVRDAFGAKSWLLDLPVAAPDVARSYDEWIFGTRRIIETATGMTVAEANEALEAAAFELKKTKHLIHSRTDFVDRFAEGVPINARVLRGVAVADRPAHIKKLRAAIADGLRARYGR